MRAVQQDQDDNKARSARSHQTKAGPKQQRAPDVDVVAEELPLIPPGHYEAVGGRASTFRFRGTFKLCLEFTVLVPDENEPSGIKRVTLLRYYNVRPAPGRRFRAGPHSDYAREWALVAGRRVARRDRQSPRFFKVLCEVEVATVTQDAAQRRLPEHARYSKVARIVERKAGGIP